MIGYDGTQSVQLLMPELATVVQPIEGIAKRTAQRLLELVELQQGESAEEAAPPMSQPEDVLPVELHLGLRCVPSQIWIRFSLICLLRMSSNKNLVF